MEKVLNNKIVWYILLGVILLLIIVFISLGSKNNNQSNNRSGQSGEIINRDDSNQKEYIINHDDNKIDEDTKKKNVTYQFELKGNKIINLDVGDTYEEPGFIAVNSNNEDVSKMVSITGEVNTNKAGNYQLIYTLKIGNYNKKLVRTVNVKQTKKNELIMNLNGEETIYLNKTEVYKELGVTAKIDNLDVSNKVRVVSDLKNGIPGKYKIKYIYQDENINKTITRDVIILDIDSYFTVVEGEKTTIMIIVDDNIKYIVLPNGTTNSNKVIYYKVNENDTYKFKLYTESLKEFEKDVVVNIVDKEPPKGTCEKILNDSKTLFKVYSNDTDIVSYNYNNLKTTSSNSYSVNGFIRDDVFVKLTDRVGNTTKINCDNIIKTKDVITPKSGETLKYKNESDSLKVYVTTKDGYYLTRVWARDPVYQLRKEVTGGKSTKNPLTLLKNAISSNNLDSKIVLGFNASGIIIPSSPGDYGAILKKDSSYAYLEATSLILTNGKVIKNDYKNYAADYPIYYVSGTNELKYIPRLTGKSASDRKKIFESVINGGAKNTFGFTKVVFVENGKANDVKWSGDSAAKRQAICQVNTNNFIVVTSNTKTVLRQPFANFLASIGCKTAFNLDGGGSTTLMYKSNDTNTVKTITGGGRALNMILYFTELE